ncbi:hypothetical protein V1522DRAFT_458220 [Lipomyces starkeyi]
MQSIKCERWVEISIRKYLNFVISTTSRVERSHGAMKRALTDIYRLKQLSIIGLNENVLVRLEIRNQIETSGLCTVISRSALELKLHLQVVEGDAAEILCDCSIWHRHRLPCFHRIRLGIRIPVADIHPRSRVRPVFPPLNINWQHIDPETLLTVRDPPVGLPRRGRPRGTRRLPTSAEIVQETADRDGKVRRCGSCHKKLLSQQSLQEMAGEDEQTANEITEAADDGDEDEYDEEIA